MNSTRTPAECVESMVCTYERYVLDGYQVDAALVLTAQRHHVPIREVTHFCVALPRERMWRAMEAA